MTAPTEMIGLLVREGKKRILLMTSILSVVSLIGLVVALTMPKKFDASTLLIIDNSQKPLATETRQTPGNEQAAITLQLMEGHKIPRELLLFGGWVQPPPAPQLDPREEARLISALRAHIKIDNPKEGMIRIAYTDSDPDRTYKIANKLAEIYIRESGEAQVRESREAFEFIDKQVKEYAEKLGTYHQQVLAHYRRQDLPPGPDEKNALPALPTVNPARPHNTAKTEDELAGLRAEKAALEAQLAQKPAGGGAANAPPVDTRNLEQLRQRVATLQTELDRLQSTYTDQHPDVKRVKRELAAAKEELKVVEDAHTAQSQEAKNAAALDDDLRRAAQVRLDEVNKRIATLTNTPVPPSVIGQKPKPASSANPNQLPDPELRGIGQDTTLAELLRRYEATRDVYQELLKKRETARVNLDLATQRGSTLRVQEPAERPMTASGMRLSHYCMIGLVLALLIPIGVLFAIVRLDRRVRTPHQIEFYAKVPLLVSIAPAPIVDKEKSKQKSHRVIAVLMLFGVAVIYVVVFILKQRAA